MSTCCIFLEKKIWKLKLEWKSFAVVQILELHTNSHVSYFVFQSNKLSIITSLFIIIMRLKQKFISWKIMVSISCVFKPLYVHNFIKFSSKSTSHLFFSNFLKVSILPSRDQINFKTIATTGNEVFNSFVIFVISTKIVLWIKNYVIWWASNRKF